MADSMILEVTEVIPGLNKAPGMIKGFEDGDLDSPRTVKAFAEILTRFEIGKTYEFDWYLGKPYQGQQDMLVSKHSPVKSLGANFDAYQSPTELPQELRRPVPASAPPVQQNTPQGVMTGSNNTKDRSITVLAVMKSVIESGGSEQDFRTWLGLHDEIVHGKNRG